MAGFLLSPGVQVVETDLTNIVPAVSTSIGAYAGAFKWGPVMQPTTISNEAELVNVFGSPDDETAVTFLTAANFLGYSNNLLVTRVAQTGQTNASVDGLVTILNDEDYATKAFSANEKFAAKYPGVLGNSLKVILMDSGNYAASLTYQDLVDSAPTGNELHVVVEDEDGLITGTPGTILEVFQFLNKLSDAKQADGSTAYYADVLNTKSKWIWWCSHPAAGWGVGPSPSALAGIFAESLKAGTNGEVETDGQIRNAYAMYADSEKYDLNLVITGAVSGANAKWIVENVAEERDPRDCIVFVSPRDINGPFTGSASYVATSMVTWRNSEFNYAGSYAVIDSGYKYQYDRYNDKYRWVPLNADVAGLCARTDNTNDPWFSPAGFSRGQIKNVVKLAYNPNKTARDILYKANINPVVSFTGEGTVLYGDKTAQTRPSAFDRINVRRLFNVLEKAISVAAKFQLFEFNDQFTRAQFRSIVEPYLRDVQGRRGITDFRVVCDETNNTGEVIDSNRFVADIYIKPARSINFITLNFIATRTGVSFAEIGG